MQPGAVSDTDVCERLATLAQGGLIKHGIITEPNELF